MNDADDIVGESSKLGLEPTDWAVGADRLVRDFSDGDRLTLGRASRMSNAFSSWHLQGRYGFIAACSAGSVRSSSG
jgi:hypothetical protein